MMVHCPLRAAQPTSFETQIAVKEHAKYMRKYNIVYTIAKTIDTLYREKEQIHNKNIVMTCHILSFSRVCQSINSARLSPRMRWKLKR